MTFSVMKSSSARCVTCNNLCDQSLINLYRMHGAKWLQLLLVLVSQHLALAVLLPFLMATGQHCTCLPYNFNENFHRSERVPANLIQAQRDYFGAHTYELLSEPGKFVHTNWTGHGGNVSASTYSA